MKKNAIMLLVILGMATVTKAQNTMAKWPELKTFHEIMSQTFHPSEEGKLDPIKTRSGELAEKATLLAKSTVPSEFNKPDMPKVLKQLEKDSKALNEMIQNKKATDAEITKALSNLHDVFHQIIGLCKKEDHH